MRIALIHSTIRGDEKLLLEAARSCGIELIALDARELVLNPLNLRDRFDVVLERCVSTTIGMHIISFFESLGIPTVNSSETARNCVDKFTTSLLLQQNNVPNVPFALAFTEKETLQAVEELGGYPVVIKPTLGSWGRLLAKINDRDALEAVLEQKQVLGSPPHKAFYIQKFVEKPGRDIRVTVVGGKAVCAIYREASHWITNTARGAEAKVCKMNKEIEDISLAAAKAVGGGILGIDLLEENGGFLVNEVNHTVEFKNVQRVTGADVAGAIIEYCKNLKKYD